MKVIAIRHGETEWNAQGREMGQLDSALTERGIQQARLVAGRLNQAAFHALYSSDLGRGIQTAEIIASKCQKQVQLDAGLRERHMGIFQGLTLAEMREKFPKERAEFERGDPDYVIPGGESARQRLERSALVLGGIAGRHSNQVVVVVTHGGFLMGFFEFVLGLQPGNGWRFKRHNASYNAFEYEGDRWSLHTWNDISHLDGLHSLDDRTVQTIEGLGTGLAKPNKGKSGAVRRFFQETGRQGGKVVGKLRWAGVSPEEGTAHAKRDVAARGAKRKKAKKST